MKQQTYTAADIMTISLFYRNYMMQHSMWNTYQPQQEGRRMHPTLTHLLTILVLLVPPQRSQSHGVYRNH